MKCTHLQLPGGAYAIACGPRPRTRRCSVCTRSTPHAQQRECDWKMGNGKTCDRLLCVGCTHSPAQGKDLCPEHAKIWMSRLEP